MAETWLPTLKTPDLQSGYELAIKLSCMADKLTRPDAEIRENLCPKYENDADALISVSAVVATHFQSIAAANDYRKDWYAN